LACAASAAGFLPSLAAACCHVIRNGHSSVERAVQWAAELQPLVLQRFRSTAEQDHWRLLAAAVGAATDTDLPDDEFADSYAQSLICGAAAVALAGPLFQDDRVRAWTLKHTNPLWKAIVEEAFTFSRAGESLPTAAIGAPAEPDPMLAFYEAFLARYDRHRRKRHGVFYTPPAMARYILSEVDRYLVQEFDLTDGLADEVTWEEMAQRFSAPSPPAVVRPGDGFVRILDPALGTGVFLAEAVKLVHARLTAKWTADGDDPGRVSCRWDQYVAGSLLPRLAGLELMLPACVVATLKLVATLAETGFSFTRPSRLEIHLANTLAGPATRQRSLFAADGNENALLQAATAGRHLSARAPFTVIVGNPPFSGISQQQGRWIVDLLRGQEGGRNEWCNYFEVDGRPLGERKTWLQDDYVKFLRYAHWKIERAGCGIVGFVTNHGYLDNPTFRGVRQQLLGTFPRITVIDLHGNRKKREQSPVGRPDENVFGIEQGTAIGLLRRPPGEAVASQRMHGELWGDAAQKLNTLEEAAQELGARDAGAKFNLQSMLPAGPNYFFVPRAEAPASEYGAAPRLPDLMPVNVTAPVTARDGFVVAFTREELLERIAEFRDLDVPDDEIRRRYFANTRSARYPPGDTRGWKLAEARRRTAADPRWQEHIRPCWYRPFDERFVYWSEGMIDWPRGAVISYLMRAGNVALVARRQMLPTQPCNYFWITNQLMLDGLIRSDNRGSESVFPLYLESAGAGASTPYRVNLDESAVTRLAGQLGLRWQPDGTAEEDAYGPLELMHYCYALFFSPAYRRRYAEPLWSDFPRVLLPRRPGLFRDLARWGARLAERHLLCIADTGLTGGRYESGGGGSPRAEIAPSWSIHGMPLVRNGFPTYQCERIGIAPGVWLEPVPQEIWNFHVGGHQVCKKWLKDRRGRTLADADLATYIRIVSAICDTTRIMIEIDAAVQAAGGWPAAFVRAEA